MRWLLIPVRATAVAGFDVVKEILVGLGVMAALLGGRATAADLKASAPPPVPYSNWSGPYIGVGVDARYNAVDGNVTSATVGTQPTAIPLPTVSEGYTNPLMWWGAGPGAMQYIDNIAFGVRLYGGWNFQVAPTYVVGLEGDFAYANEAAVFHGSPYPANLLFGSPSLPFGASPNDEFKVRTTWDGSARVRAGWLATPSMMLYLTAGLAWAHLEVNLDLFDRPYPERLELRPGQLLLRNAWACCHRALGYQAWLDGRRRHRHVPRRAVGRSRAVSFFRFRVSLFRRVQSVQLCGHTIL